MDLTRTAEVFVLTLGDTENRLDPGFLAEVGEALDEVAATPGVALVTTGRGKQYSSGLDLAWLADPANAGAAAGFVSGVQALLARMLVFPAYSVAALNGHTFAAGAMLAAAHDARVMRADRGFWCLPEADIGIPFTPGMTALLAATLSPAAQRATMLTGARFGGPGAAALGLVDEAVPADAVLDRAVEFAAAHAGKDRAVLGAIKTELYAYAVAALGRPVTWSTPRS